MILPKKVYEAIRWLIAIALPAVGLLITTLDNIWNLGLPAEAISSTLNAIGLFLGALFGISKISNDKTAKKGKK